MLPIFVMWDSEIDTFEEECIREALAEFSALSPGRNIIIYGPAAWSSGAYSSADWYILHTRKIYRRNQTETQLDARGLLCLMMSEPWQKSTPHIDVCFTSRDLGAEELNFCFGMTSGRYTVQSVYRYANLEPSDRKLAIKTVLWHELGHVLGAAADPNRSNTVERLGRHCNNPGCVMRQSINLTEFVQHARDSKRLRRIFCAQCLRDIRKATI